MERKNIEMRPSGVHAKHRKLDHLILDIHEQQQQAEVGVAETSEANNKKLDKEIQGAEEADG